MPTQEQKALIRYEALKEIIKEQKQVIGEDLFVEMFERFGIIERTTSRYLKFLKRKKYVEIKGDVVIWIKQSDS